ncbi:MAG: FAD-dependent oxidoreductase, partial [Clostridiaceae bacterium]
DIPAYIKLQGENKGLEALKVIVDKNPLPFITGTICSHTCMSKCTRNFYEESVNIRSTKLKAAEAGYQELIKTLKPVPNLKNKKVAVVGGGPAGIAASFFLAREGAEVKVFEKKENIGGVITNVVPEFRIAKTTAEKDISLARALGVEFETNHPINSLEELKASGYDQVILAVGAYKGTPLNIGCSNEINAIEFLEACRKTPTTINFGKNVVIVGAGNTAMDAARAAKRVEGVENVYVVYRRTKKYMPADEEELELALEEGVIFLELLAPSDWKTGRVICNKVLLGEMDSSGRQKPIITEEQVEVPCDLLVAALGEKVDSSYYESLGLKVNSRGYAELNPETMEGSIPGIYVIGDGAQGPATVVEAIRDANKAANSILSILPRFEIRQKSSKEPVMKKGIILPAQEEINEAERCLECNIICEACTEVCPNRANVAIEVPG